MNQVDQVTSKSHGVTRIAAMLGAAACLAWGGTTEATVINYSVTLTVEASSGTVCQPLPFIDAVPLVSPMCSASPGDTYIGRFQIERDLTGESDGLYAVPFKSLYIITGDMIWDANGHVFSRGLPNVFDGYRGYDGPDIHGFPSVEESWSLFGFAPQMGLLVRDGQVFAFAGDIYTSGDVMSLEFAYRHDNPSVSDRFLIHSEAMGGFVVGNVVISRMPAPITLALLPLGAFAGWLATRRRSRSVSS